MQLLTLHQAADLLQIHYQTARDWVLSGKLKASKPGRGWRVEMDDVRRLLRAGEFQPPTAAAAASPTPAPSLDFKTVAAAPSQATPLPPEWEIPTPAEMRKKAWAPGQLRKQAMALGARR